MRKRFAPHCGDSSLWCQVRVPITASYAGWWPGYADGHEARLASLRKVPRMCAAHPCRTRGIGFQPMITGRMPVPRSLTAVSVGAFRGGVGTDEAALCAATSVAQLIRARREHESWGCPGRRPMSLSGNGLEEIRLFLAFSYRFRARFGCDNRPNIVGSSSVNYGRCATPSGLPRPCTVYPG